MARLIPLPKFKETDDNGNPLAGGKLYTYQAGTTTPATTYTDQSGATPNANPVILDAYGRASVWLSNSSYKFVLKDSNDVTIWTVDSVSASADAADVIYRWGGTAGGTADALTLTPTNAETSYITGVRYAFLASATNTGAATVNISSLGAKSIKRPDGTALSAGEIASGSMYSMTYDGTNFRIHELPVATLVSGQTADSDPDQRADYALTYDTSAGSMKKALLYLVSQPKITTITDNYTATINDGIIRANITTSKTITLPAASTAARQRLIIKHVGTSVTAVLTVDGNSSETIDGSTTVTLYTNGETLELYCDGSNWEIVDRRFPSVMASGLTPTFNSLGSVSSTSFFWKRFGDHLFMQGTYTTGTVSASVCSITMPTGIVIDTAKLPSGSQGCAVGFSYSNLSASTYIWPGAGATSEASQVLFYDGSTNDRVFYAYRHSSSVFNKENGTIFSNSRPCSFNFMVPVSGWAG